jgi:GMP synthase-like glutamine amidotransferase
MKPVLIFQHARHEGPGFFGEFLSEHGIPQRVVRSWLGDPFPADPAEYSGLVFMGGPMSVNDPLPFLQQELALIARAAEHGTPILGHCLGGQLMSKALGGSVTRNRVLEIGWHPVWRADEGSAAGYWLADTPERFDAFHWHGETFSIPPGAAWLWRSLGCDHQAFAIGDAILAMQCHVEMTRSMIHSWTQIGAEHIGCSTATVQDAETIRRDTDERLLPMQQVARTLYQRWLARL